MAQQPAPGADGVKVLQAEAALLQRLADQRKPVVYLVENLEKGRQRGGIVGDGLGKNGGLFFKDAIFVEVAPGLMTNMRIKALLFAEMPPGGPLAAGQRGGM